MAVHTLKSLIQAAGAAGVSGQTFRNNVPDAVSGARMSDYYLYGWSNWASSDWNSSTLYASGSTIHFTFDFSAGSRWSQIRAAALDAALEGDTNAFATSTTTYGASLMGNSIAVQLFGNEITNPSGMSIYKNYFTDFDGTDVNNGEPPPDNNDYQWEIDAQATYPPTNVYDAHTLTITYLGDAGALSYFNDPLTVTYAVQVSRRINPNALDYEWHDTSTYTHVVGTGSQLTFMSGISNYTGDFWLRYRVTGDSTWTNFGQVHWYDPRFTNH